MRVEAARKSADPLVAQARQHLAARLGDTWRAGDRLPSVRDLAADLNVSLGTVQVALRELVRHGFLVALPRTGIFVAEQFSNAQLRAIFARHASSLATEKRPLAGARIVVYISDQATHMFPAVEALQTELASQGCHITQRECGLDDDAVPYAGDPEADVLVLVNPSSECRVQTHEHQRVLVLQSAATLCPLNLSRYDVVTLDQEQGAALAGQYLRQRGCESACMVGVGTPRGERRTFETSAPPYLPTAQIRLQGFEQGWGEKLPEQHKLYAGSYSPLSGAMIARVYAAMEPRPRGIFLVSDDLASGFVNGLATLGLRLRRDYELVGFDGQRIFKQLCQGQATSVEVPANLMGRLGAQLLLDRVQHPDRPGCKLLVGCTLPGLP